MATASPAAPNDAMDAMSPSPHNGGPDPPPETLVPAGVKVDAALAAESPDAAESEDPSEAVPEEGEDQPRAAAALPPIRVTVAPCLRRSVTSAWEDGGRSSGKRVIGLFHPNLYLTGGDCIEVDGQMMSRSAFERIGGSATAKWYVSIKVLPDYVTLGCWLQRRGLPVLKGKSRRRLTLSASTKASIAALGASHLSRLPPNFLRPAPLPPSFLRPAPLPNMELLTPLSAAASDPPAATAACAGQLDLPPQQPAAPHSPPSPLEHAPVLGLRPMVPAPCAYTVDSTHADSRKRQRRMAPGIAQPPVVVAAMAAAATDAHVVPSSPEAPAVCGAVANDLSGLSGLSTRGSGGLSHVHGGGSEVSAAAPQQPAPTFWKDMFGSAAGHAPSGLPAAEFRPHLHLHGVSPQPQSPGGQEQEPSEAVVSLVHLPPLPSSPQLQPQPQVSQQQQQGPLDCQQLLSPLTTSGGAPTAATATASPWVQRQDDAEADPWVTNDVIDDGARPSPNTVADDEEADPLTALLLSSGIMEEDWGPMDPLAGIMDAMDPTDAGGAAAAAADAKAGAALSEGDGAVPDRSSCDRQQPTANGQSAPFVAAAAVVPEEGQQAGAEAAGGCEPEAHHGREAGSTGTGCGGGEAGCDSGDAAAADGVASCDGVEANEASCTRQQMAPSAVYGRGSSYFSAPAGFHAYGSMHEAASAEHSPACDAGCSGDTCSAGGSLGGCDSTGRPVRPCATVHCPHSAHTCPHECVHCLRCAHVPASGGAPLAPGSRLRGVPYSGSSNALAATATAPPPPLSTSSGYISDGDGPTPEAYDYSDESGSAWVSGPIRGAATAAAWGRSASTGGAWGPRGSLQAPHPRLVRAAPHALWPPVPRAHMRLPLSRHVQPYPPRPRSLGSYGPEYGAWGPWEGASAPLPLPASHQRPVGQYGHGDVSAPMPLRRTAAAPHAWPSAPPERYVRRLSVPYHGGPVMPPLLAGEPAPLLPLGLRRCYTPPPYAVAPVPPRRRVPACPMAPAPEDA